MEITKDDVKNQLILSEAGTTINNTTFQNYTFTFHVSPYPEAGKKIAKSDYRLYLTVSKLGQWRFSPWDKFLDAVFEDAAR